MGIVFNGMIHIRIISNLPPLLLLEHFILDSLEEYLMSRSSLSRIAFGSHPNPFSCFCPNTYLVLIGGRLILAHISNHSLVTSMGGYLAGALSRSWELISPSSISDLWFVNLVVFLTLLNTRIAKSRNWPKCFS
jgi:hypothetical protein